MIPGFRGSSQVSAFVASLDVKPTFDVANPSVVSKILTHTETHGHVVAAVLEEMKDGGSSACFENCDTQLRIHGA